MVINYATVHFFFYQTRRTRWSWPDQFDNFFVALLRLGTHQWDRFFAGSKYAKSARVQISLYRGLFKILQLRRKRHVLLIYKRFIVCYFLY